MITVISFQTQRMIDPLLSGTALYTLQHYVPADWSEAYQWMRAQMIERVGPPPVENGLMMWGWPLGGDPEEGNALGSETEPLYRIELSLENDTVLVSDFSAWHVVLSGHYVGKNAADTDRHDALLKKTPQAAALETQASWERIFDPARLGEEDWGKPAERIYQLCFWQPKASAFKSRRKIS